jgi:hypothetical protein
LCGEAAQSNELKRFFHPGNDYLFVRFGDCAAKTNEKSFFRPAGGEKRRSWSPPRNSCNSFARVLAAKLPKPEQKTESTALPEAEKAFAVATA